MRAIRPWDPVPAEPIGELGPTEAWAAAKQIDGIPGEWTYPLWVSRAVRFHVPVRTHYERLRDYDEVVEMITIANIVENANLRPPSIRLVLAVYEGCMDAQDGYLAPPEPDERFLGHHDVEVLGWADRGDELIFGNSWGANWGDANTGRISRAYYEAHAKEVWLRMMGNQGLHVPDGFEWFDPALKRQAVVKAWRRGARQGQVVLGRGRTIDWFTVKSLKTVGQTYVGGLRDSRRVTLGWCNLSVGSAGGHTDALITDLYVWPYYRGQGVGHALYDWAIAIAEAANASKLQVTVHEADVESSHNVPRQAMAERFGLQWFEAHPVDAAQGVSALASRYMPSPDRESQSTELP
jgi:GNAT superfamily N-acetyltransferase